MRDVIPQVLQTSLDLGEFVRETPARTGGGRKPRKPPLVRCRCGRQHRTWNPHKVCSACVRESRSARLDEVHARVVEQERRRLRPTPAELAADNEARAEIHARWLARQSLDHPWRVARAGGEA